MDDIRTNVTSWTKIVQQSTWARFKAQSFYFDNSELIFFEDFFGKCRGWNSEGILFSMKQLLLEHYKFVWIVTVDSF